LEEKKPEPPKEETVEEIAERVKRYLRSS